VNDTQYDVLGIGNAIVDVLSRADDDFLIRRGLAKGAMQLIDEDDATALYDAMAAGVEMSGGSAANTIAGIASFGGRAAFFGKLRDDQLGDVFAHDIRSLGVAFDTVRATSGPATARCLVLVTPDGQRTLNTFLGASSGLGPGDVDEAAVAAAKVTYLEGYLWDPHDAKQAFIKAARVAREAGRLVSLTLSDAFCVERHRDEFRGLVRREVDILFANEAEIMSLYEVDSFDAALQTVRHECRLCALTRSEAGSVVTCGEEIHVVDAARVATVVDTTGAGDLYAAGFLYGLTRDLPLVRCAELGGLAAAEVISHIGARPQTNLAAHAREHGLL
jgi:sugar/nucleoside kinase (ribokinase family)